MMQADTLEAALNWTLRQSEENMQAAFDQAFRGELVPTEASLARAENRAYENAGVLLERIQAEISLCKAIPRPKSPKRVAMKTLTSDILKVCIAGLPQDTFTFAELQRNYPAKYDELQKALFELLDEPQPIVRQVFNKKEQKMQFQRLIP